MSAYQRYAAAQEPLPTETWAWNMYGAGLENIGRNGQPERLPLPQPGPDQLLIRIDAVGMCFSDVKIIQQGGKHPKLYGRDLAVEPTRLGHEVSATVVAVGEALRDRYYPGQRVAIQPDLYQAGRSTAYGYTIPGGLTQYQVIGPEVLVTDAGPGLLPLEGPMGYAEAALLEPWGCVMAAYTQRRRLQPLPGGIMWIIGHPGDETPYRFSNGLEAPARIVLTDAPPAVQALVANTQAEVIVRDGLTPDAYAALAAELTGGRGFDDIIILDPRTAAQVEAAARYIARRGTLNLVGQEPLDGSVPVDLGRLHYDYIAFVGNRGPDIAASYGEARNRCELRPHGVAVFVGAGGPMGQMHVQRAIELTDGPDVIIATEVSDERLATLAHRYEELAAAHDRTLLLFNPKTADLSLHQFVMQVTAGRGADDVVVCVPVASVMAEAATLMNPDGMLVLFAGVPIGTLAPLDVSMVYLHNAQYTGTSGLTIEDQAEVMRRALANTLSPERMVAAVGGMKAAREALAALIEGRYPGKIVIFPHLFDLPLMSLEEVAARWPEVAARLGPGGVWTNEAEAALFEAVLREASEGAPS
ncbi:MAG: zinc-binding dehydrogenase [Caldilineales bacterium]|nr:zinc-binding dehydrogenase [Caldilineales bacterium]